MPGLWTYPTTCGGCVKPLDNTDIEARIRRGERVECPHCGKVLHRGGTVGEAVAVILAESPRGG